jgi:hypothetical protein
MSESIAPEDVRAAGAGEPPVEPAPEETARRRMNRHVRMVLDHLWGPTGSVLLHILILFVLLRCVTGITDRRDVDIEVVMMEPETADLEEMERELEEIRNVEVDIAPADADVVMEQPPDVAPMSTPYSGEDFAALDIKADVPCSLVMKDFLPAVRRKGGRGWGGSTGGKRLG